MNSAIANNALQVNIVLYLKIRELPAFLNSSKEAKNSYHIKIKYTMKFGTKSASLTLIFTIDVNGKVI